MSKILMIQGHNGEVVMSFKCLGTVINCTDDETEEIKAKCIPLCKLYLDINRSTEMIK